MLIIPIPTRIPYPLLADHTMEMKSNQTMSSISRPLADFPPSVWGDRFLFHTPQSIQNNQAWEEQVAKELELQVKREMKEQLAIGDDHIKQLQMVDAIQRLGISYLFEEEIDAALHNLFQLHHQLCKDSHDMYTVALTFRLLRQHGFRVSCQIFEKFRDAKGGFKVPSIEEVAGMLEFFEATHLRIRGEDLLDHGYTFSRNYLETVLPSLDAPDSEQVHYALNQYSNWRGLPRLASRHYISIYHHYASHHQGLLRLATLEFNRLLSLHKSELSDIYRWWKSLDVATNLPFARDRMVEIYFWAVAVYFEPEYALARKMLAKVHALLSLLDDIYDAYGTFDELQILTEAIERWNMSYLDRLPDYMKLFYKALLQVLEEIEGELTKQGRSYRTTYGIQVVKDLTGYYFAEIEWRERKYRPTIDEYLHTATRSCGYVSLILLSFLGMGDAATKEAFDWVLSEPNIVKASLVICRLTADIVGHQFERERVHIPSAVECFTEENNVSKEETIDELKNRIETAWKDLNEGLLRPTKISASLLHRILNFNRVIEVMYSKGDWYTHVGPEMQSFITQLLIDSISN